MEDVKDEYVYEPIDSANGQIRLLSLPVAFDKPSGPLRGTVETFDLPLSNLPRPSRLARFARLPSFSALSYVWGDPQRCRVLIVNGKRLGITEHLYRALVDLQLAAVHTFWVWADAVCICQQDLVERSAQVLLMREVYGSAEEVNIWLGLAPNDGRIRCLNFISVLTGTINTFMSDDETSHGKEKPIKLLSMAYKPFSLFVRAGVGVGQAGVEIGNLISPVREDHAQLLDVDEMVALRQKTLTELQQWRPHERHLRRIKDENFSEIAKLIETTIIQNSAWFARMWVVQELSTAEDPCIIANGGRITWTDFIKAVWYLDHQLGAHVPSLPVLLGLEAIRLGFSVNKRQPLRALLQACEQRRATDPRDKIFSLVGLMGDRLDPYLKPDYNRDVDRVYALATMHFIVQSQSLDPICGWQSRGRMHGLPSWVPDYDLNQDIAPASLVPRDGRRSLFAAAGMGERSKYTFLETCPFPDPWDRLPTKGLIIDTVAEMSESTCDSEDFGYIATLWSSVILGTQVLKEEVIHAARSEIGAVLSAVQKLSLGQQSSEISSIMSEGALMTTSASTIGSKPVDIMLQTNVAQAFCYCLFSGQISQERLKASQINELLALATPSAGFSPHTRVPLTSTTQQIFDALEAKTKQRNLGVTRKGHLGTLPQEAQVGDLICILYGCSVPVVLHHHTERKVFQVVGECYLHGFMDAEALSLLHKGELAEQVFVLS